MQSIFTFVTDLPIFSKWLLASVHSEYCIYKHTNVGRSVVVHLFLWHFCHRCDCVTLAAVYMTCTQQTRWSVSRASISYKWPARSVCILGTGRSLSLVALKWCASNGKLYYFVDSLFITVLTHNLEIKRITRPSVSLSVGHDCFLMDWKVWRNAESCRIIVTSRGSDANTFPQALEPFDKTTCRRSDKNACSID